MISAIMGRIYFDQKQEADSLNKLNTWDLNRKGFFDGFWKSGTITWTNGWSGNKNSIAIEVFTSDQDNHIRLKYTLTDRNTGEEKHIDCNVPLTSTTCYFGGKRYWFQCSVYKSGVYCGRRVATLYRGGDYFACRHCYELSYNSRNLSGISKAVGQVISIPEIEQLVRDVKRKYYKGKMTRRYKRLLKKQIKSMRQLRIMADGFSATKKRKLIDDSM